MPAVKMASAPMASWNSEGVKGWERTAWRRVSWPAGLMAFSPTASSILARKPGGMPRAASVGAIRSLPSVLENPPARGDSSTLRASETAPFTCFPARSNRAVGSVTAAGPAGVGARPARGGWRGSAVGGGGFGEGGGPRGDGRLARREELKGFRDGWGGFWGLEW